MDLEFFLKKQFGFEQFRPGQKEVITHVVNGEDTIAIFPTGMGKSLCYQLPGYVMDGVVLIISPLVALMEDQVATMRKQGEKRVAALNSFLTRDEKTAILNSLGNYKFIFLSPEMLVQSQVFNLLKRITLSLIVVDEAHCISEWGFDFRPDYLRMRDFLSADERPPVLALTATADDRVVADIVSYLHLREPRIERQSLDRPNIAFTIEQVADEQEKTEWIRQRLAATTGPGIIYVASRKRADQLAEELADVCPAVASYHGGKDQDDRSIIQEQFIQGQLSWICATNAFGMGIHKDNIRQIIHEHLPATPSAYMQEVGRAGRDGNPSAATLLYAERDLQKLRFIVYDDLPDEPQIRYYHSLLASGINETLAAEQAGLSEVGMRLLAYYFERFGLEEAIRQIGEVMLLKERQLMEMFRFVTSSGCLREHLLALFGERYKGVNAACCSSCGLGTSLEWLMEDEQTPEQTNRMNWKERIEFLLG